MPIDLNKCTEACLDCVKAYKKKHRLTPGSGFKLPCKGILSDEELDSVLSAFPSENRNAAETLLDPVKWAADNLDWHCLDPDGEIWKRKNPAEYYKWVAEHPGESIYGKSRYHRPYQALMLRCTSQFKIFRIGRQCGKTEALVVSMIYHMFTTPGLSEGEGFKIVLITPYLEQIDLVFKRIEELILNSSILKDSIAQNKKAPNYTIQLYNGSRIKGFTAGSKSGGNADSVRGQHAHMLVFDEADYLAAADMDSAMAIVTNFPTASVWMSSTPTGRRERFFNTCFMPEWKEFHFTSHINPLWGPWQENLFRSQNTEAGYKHEVLADFGDREEGVFQNSYVDVAKADYEYGQISPSNEWKYTIGVDWNDTKNGSTIAVLGLSPIDGKFYLVDTAIVSRAGWTQLAACQKLLDLNRIWKPFSIYIDAGHGGTQWEVLRKFSYDSSLDKSKPTGHPDTKLKNILKRYDFGAKIETRDLWNKNIIKKDAKPFLVENLVRRFESGTFMFPKNDKSLAKQLAGYIIKRISQSGRPVYEASDEVAGDHLLDAVMLASVAFTLEATPFGKPAFDSNIAFSGQFGQIFGDAYSGKGDLIVQQDAALQRREAKDRLKPDGERWENSESGNILDQNRLPASHVNDRSSLSPSIYSWPGFERDAPKPSRSSIAKKFRMSRLRSPPRRKNI